MTIDQKIDVEDELKGKKVHIEVHLRSGTGGGSDEYEKARTLLYSGTYQGTGFIGTQEVIVLEKARHWGKSYTFVSDGKGKESPLIRSKKTYIALNDFISIDLME